MESGQCVGRAGSSTAGPAFRDWLRRQLARDRLAVPGGDYDLNPGMRSEAPESLTPAGVLVPIVERPAEPTVLLTRRADHLRDHAGQVSFPGGRLEPSDRDPVAAALRETEEEIGLDRRHVEIMGLLDSYETRTGYHIIPVVGLVQPTFDLTIDDIEVAEVFEVPLSLVLDPSKHERHTRLWRGVERHFYVLPFECHYIWGATAGMLVNLHRRLVG